MAEIATRLRDVRATLPSALTLIVVTKNFPVSDIEILYQLGERNFGENRVQELIAKRELLPREINENAIFHFQGQIQSNKIASLDRHADVIHSIDSLKAVAKFSRERKVFLQVNLDQRIDGDRGGIPSEKIEEYATALVARYESNFLGVMGVAPHYMGIGKGDVSAAFKRLHQYSRRVEMIAPEARFISAGMSDDYPQAIEQGATHIRLGSSILGPRVPGA